MENTNLESAHMHGTSMENTNPENAHRHGTDIENTTQKLILNAIKKHYRPL